MSPHLPAGAPVGHARRGLSCSLSGAARAQVMLVKHAGRHYALKTLHKAQIIEMGLQARPAPAVGAPVLRSAARVAHGMQ